MNTMPATTRTPSRLDETLHRRLRSEAAAVGRAAGRIAATWWVRHMLRGPDACLVASLTVSGIDSGDRDVVEALPSLAADAQTSGLPAEAALYPPPAPGLVAMWPSLDIDARDRAAAVYRDSHNTAARDAITRHCLATLRPSEPADPPQHAAA